MSFPRGYNPSSAKVAGLVAKSSPKGLHEFGEVQVETPYGNEVRAYGAERTLCDMLRGTASPGHAGDDAGAQGVSVVAQRDLPKLQSFADELRGGKEGEEDHGGAAVRTRNAMQLKALINNRGEGLQACRLS